MAARRIRVLVVDDSALMRRMLGDIVNSDPECELAGTARNGEEGLRMAQTLRPDVVTLDVEMPDMDGMAVLRKIMGEHPLPVIMVTGLAEYKGVETVKCLEFGAVDLVIKPSGTISIDINKVKDELLAKIKIASRVNLASLHPQAVAQPPFKPVHSLLTARKIIGIASSTGGPLALARVIPLLAADLPAAVIIVQHMPEGFTNSLADRLDSQSAIQVREAKDGDLLKQGAALVAPGGFQLNAQDSAEGARVKIFKGPKEHGVAPAADVAFRSLAGLYGKDCLAVILTGMGSDGVEGARLIKAAGGRVIVQDEGTSAIYGMPKAAADAGLADEIVPIEKMAERIMYWVRK